MPGHIIIHLAHRIRVNLTSDNGAENIGRNEDALRRQLVIGIRNKLRDDVRLGASLRIRLVKCNLLHGAVRGKPDIIKLYLVKPDLRRLRAHFHQIVPDLLAVGIDPGQPLIVAVKAAIRVL